MTKNTTQTSLAKGNMKLVCKRRFNLNKAPNMISSISLSLGSAPCPHIGLKFRFHLGVRWCTEASNLNSLRFKLPWGNSPEFCWRSGHPPLASYLKLTLFPVSDVHFSSVFANLRFISLATQIDLEMSVRPVRAIEMSWEFAEASKREQTLFPSGWD